MDRIFLLVLNMSLVGSFVIAAIWIARILLKSTPKFISYYLWMVAGLRLLFPFTIQGAFSLVPFRQNPIPLTVLTQDVVHHIYVPPEASIVNMQVPPAPPMPRFSVLPDMPYVPDAEVVVPFIENPITFLISVGAFLWFIGAAAMLVYGIASYFILKNKLKSATHIFNNVFEAENIKSPFVLGFLSPKIYLPLGLSEDERAYIILHEQTHIRRGDHIAKFGAYIVLCLHWFNPLVWFAFSLMVADMEMSCDERVLKKFGVDVKKQYSLSLVSFATDERFFAGSPLAFGEHGVKERVKNVLKFKKHSRIFIAAVSVVTIIFGIGFLFSRTETSAYEPEDYSDEYPVMSIGMLEWGREYVLNLVNEHMLNMASTDFRIPDATPIFDNFLMHKMEIYGYEPYHNVSIARFAPDAQISLYFERTPINLQGRNIYPVRIRNHDLVYLPLEPLFDFLDIEYVWYEDANSMRIMNMFNAVVLEANVYRNLPEVNLRSGEVSDTMVEVPPTLITRDSGLYVKSDIFISLVKNLPLTWLDAYSIQRLWTPLIYHDLEKVVLVSHEKIHFPHYNMKLWEMERQFRRADFPIIGEAPVMIITSQGYFSSFREYADEVIFETGTPFFINTERFDYVMLPLHETLELLGLEFYLDGDTTVFMHEIQAGDYTWRGQYLETATESEMMRFSFTADVPVFLTDEPRLSFHLGNEIAPMIVDDVLFVSHSDLANILINVYRDHQFIGIHLHEQSAELQIRSISFSRVPNPLFYDAVGDPTFVNTEMGNVIRLCHEDATFFGPMPQGHLYSLTFRLNKRETPANLDVTLFINESIPIMGEFRPSTDNHMGFGNWYSVHFEHFAIEPMNTLDLLIYDNRNIAVAGLSVTIYPLIP
ncbi:MAG: M56 family metallopeptidase [Defluviitaleaceae bacterium]|nr:M56 family metallopeptidase [Defluviitaleaceae bacterium]